MRSKTAAGDAGIRRKCDVLLGSVLLLLLGGAARARADADLLVEEPINLLGQISPTGHVTLMMEQLCPAGPVRIRLCKPGESGAVIGRYSGIGGYDWLAIAPGAYLYAVDEASGIPAKESPEGLVALRERYVVQHPSAELAALEVKQWDQLLGSSYRRQIFAIHLHTTAVQDARLMEWLNARDNHAQFNFFLRNCADFVREMLNVLYPGAIHRSVVFDVGLTTPKQLAAALHKYSQKHSKIDFRVDVIPQVAGSIARSTKICGVMACLAWKRPYLYPLTMLEPIGVATTAAVGICDRRYNVQNAIGKATKLEPGAASLSDGHTLLPARTIAHKAVAELE